MVRTVSFDVTPGTLVLDPILQTSFLVIGVRAGSGPGEHQVTVFEVSRSEQHISFMYFGRGRNFVDKPDIVFKP